MKGMIGAIGAVAVVAGLLAFGGRTAQAVTSEYYYDQVYTGATPSGGDWVPLTATTAWLKATFTDEGVPAGEVLLTLEALHLTPGEFISTVWFNVDNETLLGGLNYGQYSETGSFNLPELELPGESNSGGLPFDLSLGFSTSNKGGKDESGFSIGRFDGTDVLSIRLYNDQHNLSVGAFEAIALGHNDVAARTAAFFQGLPGGQSGHVKNEPTETSTGGGIDPLPEYADGLGAFLVLFLVAAGWWLRRKSPQPARA
jgi:hypothetical protein